MWGPPQRDRLLALLAAAFGASVVVAACSIEDSLLSDAVGAGGVPQGVGLAMVLAAVALFTKSWQGAAGSASEIDAAADARPWQQVLLRTSALVGILLLYAAGLPGLGYPLSISMLVLASGWLAGAAPHLPLLCCAALAGPGLWLLFDRLLQVRMPSGTLWAL